MFRGRQVSVYNYFGFLGLSGLRFSFCRGEGLGMGYMHFLSYSALKASLSFKKEPRQALMSFQEKFNPKPEGELRQTLEVFEFKVLGEPKSQRHESQPLKPKP